MKAKIKVEKDSVGTRVIELPGLAIVRPKATALSLTPERDDFLDRAALVYEVLDSNPDEAREAIKHWVSIHGL